MLLDVLLDVVFVVLFDVLLSLGSKLTISTRVLWLRRRIPFVVTLLVVTPLVVTPLDVTPLVVAQLVVAPLVVTPLVVEPLAVGPDDWVAGLSLTFASLRTERVRRLLLSG